LDGMFEYKLCLHIGLLYTIYSINMQEVE
jgi:hypothetical protein